MVTNRERIVYAVTLNGGLPGPLKSVPPVYRQFRLAICSAGASARACFVKGVTPLCRTNTDSP